MSISHKPDTLKAWIRQPLSLLCADGGLSKPAAIVLALIIDRATDSTPPKPVQVQLDQLAWISGYSVRTVRRALDDLTRRDLLAVTHTGRASVYTLTGAVELLPPKRQPAPRAASKSGRPDDDLAEYQAVLAMSQSKLLQPPELIPADLGVCSVAAPADGDGYDL